MWRPEFDIRCLLQSLSAFFFGDRISLNWPPELTSKPQWSSCLHVPSPERANTCPCSWLLTWVLEDWKQRSSRLHSKFMNWAVSVLTSSPALWQTVCSYVWLCHLALFQLGWPIAVCFRKETQLATMEMKKGKARDVESEHEFPLVVCYWLWTSSLLQLTQLLTRVSAVWCSERCLLSELSPFGSWFGLKIGSHLTVETKERIVMLYKIF